MMVPKEEMYGKLREYKWMFNGAEYDLYSTVDIDAEDNHTFDLHGIVFTLGSMNMVTVVTAKINAEGTHEGKVVQFTFTGTRCLF